MADDIGWEAVTLEGELAHRASLISISLSGQPSLCDNAPEIDPRGHRNEANLVLSVSSTSDHPSKKVTGAKLRAAV